LHLCAQFKKDKKLKKENGDSKFKRI